MKTRKIILERYFPKNSIGAEIGVHKGEFSEEILKTVKPKKLFLVDPWVSLIDDKYKKSWYGEFTSQKEMDERYKKVCQKFLNYRNILILRKFSTEITNDIEDNSLDFVYIDGDHTFDSVCKDFDIFFKKVKKGGIIAGDDYINNNWWGNGVIDAVHLNLFYKDLKVIYLEKDQFVLKKMSQ